MLVIGTAGHIDHGKSSIVKRLTNTDPDRLPEEKERGMTIDLGFAFYQTPSDDTIAFVDVPGHERFVKNMVAGAGGIDSVLLVVAADDGWMPQSEEHFQIVKMLNIKHGAIALNKVDLADDELVELLELEIKEKVAGTFLENAPIFRISAVSGEGFDELQNYLNKLSSKISARKSIGKPRLYIDRSFIRPGIGGVVTGTLRDGKLSAGQTVNIFPSLKKAKIKSLHSNNQDVETAIPGQRTAVSFTGVDKEILKRGGVVLADKNYDDIIAQPVLAVSLDIVDDFKLSVDDGRKVLMILGTSEIEGEVRLYEQKSLRASQSGIVFFKPDDPMFCLVGDYFIVRLPTPMVTVGGGQVLERLKHFPRKKDIKQYEYLNQRLKMTLENIIVSELSHKIIVESETLLEFAAFSKGQIEAGLKKLHANKVISYFKQAVYLTDQLESSIAEFKDKINNYLSDKPHLNGIPADQIEKVATLSQKQVMLLINYLIDNAGMEKTKDGYNITGRDINLTGAVKKAYDDIMVQIEKGAYAPPPLTKLAGGGKVYREAIKFIIDTNRAYKCGSEFIFSQKVWDEVIRYIKEKLNDADEIGVADLRDKFGFSRKYVIPIIEETDRIKLTARSGDVRIKGALFEDKKFDL